MPETRPLPQYRAPALAPENALLYNSLSIRSLPALVHLGRAECAVSLLPFCAGFTPRCALELDINGHSCLAEADGTFFLLFHPAFAGLPMQDAQPDERLLPEDVRGALAQALLAPLLQSIGAALSAAIAIRSVRFSGLKSPNAAARICLSLTCRKNGADGTRNGSGEEIETLLVRLSFAKSASAAAVSSLFHLLPLRKNGFLVPLEPGIPLELSFEAGFVRLPREAVSSLAPDDVLIPEEWKLPKALLARVWHGGGCLCATCAVEGTNAALTSPLTEDTMEPTDTSDLELRLSFELERRLITLGDLSALEPGYTFALGCDASSPVTIRVNGKALAQGRLVDMNGTLGVQVLHTL